MQKTALFYNVFILFSVLCSVLFRLILGSVSAVSLSCHSLRPQMLFVSGMFATPLCTLLNILVSCWLVNTPYILPLLIRRLAASFVYDVSGQLDIPSVTSTMALLAVLRDLPLSRSSHSATSSAKFVQVAQPSYVTIP